MLINVNIPNIYIFKKIFPKIFRENMHFYFGENLQILISYSGKIFYCVNFNMIFE